MVEIKIFFVGGVVDVRVYYYNGVLVIIDDFNLYFGCS